MTSPKLELVAKGTPNSQRVAILARFGEMELAYAAIPEPGPTQVRVKITYVGICGSDLEAYRGSRAPEFMTTPARLGHEVAGVLDKVGSKVVGLRVGDQVTVRHGGARARACTPNARRRSASPPHPPPPFPTSAATCGAPLPSTLRATRLTARCCRRTFRS